MAKFIESYLFSKGNEGVYSNDPDDPGGETYHGIARNKHPYWPGWPIIDTILSQGIDIKVFQSDELSDLTKLFYEERFWLPILGDHIDSQIIANELFDSSINMGVSVAVRFLQETLNLLNNNQRVWFDIMEDGVMGKMTLKTLSTAIVKRKPIYILKFMNALQGEYYINIMRKRPSQEKWAAGWINRATPNYF